jgi:hypothetical protein
MQGEIRRIRQQGRGFPRIEGYCGEELNFTGCEDVFDYGHFKTINGDIDRR